MKTKFYTFASRKSNAACRLKLGTWNLKLETKDIWLTLEK